MTSPGWNIGIATGCCPHVGVLDVLPTLEEAGYAVDIGTFCARAVTVML